MSILAGRRETIPERRWVTSFSAKWSKSEAPSPRCRPETLWCRLLRLTAAHAFNCKQGLTCRCTRGQLFGWVDNGKGLAGVQAEYARVPLADATAFKIPEGIEDEPALFLGDILAIGFFRADMAGVTPGGVYAVIGCGPVGLLAIVGARELGAETVFAIDRLPERLELAKGFGATPVHAGTEDAKFVLSILDEATGGRGADAVLEVVGSPEATRLAVDLSSSRRCHLRRWRPHGIELRFLAGRSL